MLTTRESDVAKYADSQSLQHQMHLLNESESWNLLHQKVFGEQNCPAALQRIGRHIASNCGGLPLAIHVIGGLLSKAKRSKDFWEHVANDIRAAIAQKDEKFSNILSLSYNHLPNHLKPCFLYMGAFPEDYKIRASRVIRLGVAEGFLKSNGDTSLEEVAEDCLKALVDRNLLSIRELKSNGKPGSYIIHDLLRDLCMRKADQEKFLHVKNWQVHNVPKGTFYSLRRVSAHTSYRIGDNASIEFMSLARSFLFIGPASRVILSPVFFPLRLLRVLDILHVKFYQFPTEILQLVNLRYLAIHCSRLPSEISRLWNLQTLIGRIIFLPSEIWEISELRHVKIMFVISIESHYSTNFVLEKLQTISTVHLQTISTAHLHKLINSDLLGCIPNINNLGISCVLFPTSVADLSHLHELETLKCSSVLSSTTRTFLSKLRFPHSVRKLTLRKSAIPWRFITTLCALPNLEVLKLRGCVFEGEEIQAKDEEWEATEGEELCSLQFLLLENLNVVHWRADQTNFPRLRRLVIRGCSALKEIPCGIGEIPTLEIIELDKSSPSAVASARQIQEEQREFENYGLQVIIC